MFLQRRHVDRQRFQRRRFEYGSCKAEAVLKSSFRDLRVWRESMDLAIEIYRVSTAFPVDERFAMALQLKRAAVSISSNIAEGARRSRRPFLLHLEMALGSQAEVEVQLELAHRLGFSQGG